MDVEIEGLRVERGGRLVLDVQRLHVRSERTTAILGPNGSGKTTLLRAIAGLERPLAGSIRFGGAAVRPGRDVAFVFQEQVVLTRSVRENLELGLRLRGVPRADRDTRIDEAVALLGIGHLLDRRADQVSGGEGRRLSLARAVCLRAPLVLLDEPLAGLDGRAYGRLLDELPQVLSTLKATTLLVTHTREEALRLADDLVVLVDGTVQASGGKREVATAVAGPAVADVLGYAVLAVDGKRVAVPPGALTLGAGPRQFSLVVDHVVDLVDRREIVGRIGDVHVHVVLPPDGTAPAPGDRVLVHAEQLYDLV
jgi:ABC-type sugar transport system ATPase subunit